ncbi:ATP synthase F0 subunit 8 (mitochondrion) [Neophocaena asiaeorientalis]|uniref:ATP synthase complex subunit 8 n=4 Tax=Neophocaena TaxID=34891 RepID=A0A1P8C7M4_NEOAA|nr:ATP synthase F0 subunit 8 [Neophocaena phocaenoides]YP_009121450.1 ATP synthase F0 subunit 8 [Neophocaena asiaeorientalis]AKH61378.1 ATP synthase F0 subunit 8 [Neophocaena asiaeorientalis sunameri]AOV83562.1 ATP synthase F0 subunit 8 [Neophocaena asiaeorientalis asiaeorientalis]AGM48315.1 ATP synthase F0 subunit 8 [Neophocaena phocaenoides]AJF41823.1 ATP synthase F0 subunit 8 [Neophocaena asiaeorientalis]APZ83071.1 ATP synthase F0 subunit 8 [Neophocaena asiaeorientalis sunameri]
MPQLDTSTWLLTILSMIFTLFALLQLKISKHLYSPTPKPTPTKMQEQQAPWNHTWTKIYLPLS